MELLNLNSESSSSLPSSLRKASITSSISDSVSGIMTTTSSTNSYFSSNSLQFGVAGPGSLPQ